MQGTTRPLVAHRLPGEPADTAELEEVDHWRTVYRELLITFDQLLSRLPADHSDLRADQHLWVRRQELAERLRHWDRRSQQLRLP
jgi:hypothetical protein